MWCVTILILIDGFLQYSNQRFWEKVKRGHNPYFNRWFSAIIDMGSFPSVQSLSQSLF